MRALGFSDQVDSVEQNKCPFCKQPIRMEDFRDALSKREYQISGLCQKCQDEMFGSDEDE